MMELLTCASAAPSRRAAVLPSFRVNRHRRRATQRVCAKSGEDPLHTEGKRVEFPTLPRRDHTDATGRRAAVAAMGAAGALSVISSLPGRALAFLGDENLVTIRMGDKDGRLVFVPDYIKLEKDTLYRLRVVNDSDIYHNWVAQDFLLKGAFWVPIRIEESTGECEFIIMPKQVGTWPYVCTVLGHKKMKGVIEVVERERKY